MPSPTLSREDVLALIAKQDAEYRRLTRETNLLRAQHDYQMGLWQFFLDPFDPKNVDKAIDMMQAASLRYAEYDGQCGAR